MRGSGWIRAAVMLLAVGALAAGGVLPATRVVAQGPPQAGYTLPEDYASVQGQRGWRYYEADAPGSYRELSFDSTVAPWGEMPRPSWNSDTSRFLEITGPPDPFILPGEGVDAAIGWEAQMAGHVTIRAELTALSTSTEYASWCGPECDDGVEVTIFLGDQVLAGPAKVLHGDPVFQSSTLEVEADVATGETVIFYVARGRWQDNDQTRYRISIIYGDDGGLGPSPTPCVPRPGVICGSRDDGGDQFTGYEVTVATANEDRADSRAHVSVWLYGTGGETSAVLNPPPNGGSFPRGGTRTFTGLGMRDVGDITRVRVTHDNDGADPDWYCSTVTVTRTTTGGDGPPWTFPVYSWLPTRPGGVFEAEATVDEDAMGYYVEVATGDEPNAGTDADVQIALGGWTTAGPFLLDMPGVDDHERASSAGYWLRGVDVGDVSTVTLSHDGSGSGPGWLPSTVLVRHMGTGDSCTFPAYGWIPTSTGSLELTVWCPDTGVDETGYDVRVKTGGMEGAGTDANVSIVLRGTVADTDAILLDDASVNDFERGATNAFSVREARVGVPSRIRLSHDGTGSAAEWYVEWVSVRDLATGQTWTYDVHSWLPPSAGEAASVEVDANVLYRAVVTTVAEANAGTDADVTLSLVGDWGATTLPPVLLDDPDQDDFEQGSTGTYEFSARSIGGLSDVVLSTDGSGDSPRWYPATAVVTNTATGEACTASFYRWIPDDAGASSAQVACGIGEVGYWVRIETQDAAGAGTDADVTIALVGDLATTEVAVLDDPGRDDFERGTTHDFYITVADAGELSAVRLAHDGSGGAAEWRPSHVWVRDVRNDLAWEGEAGDWIPTQDGAMELEVPMD